MHTQAVLDLIHASRKMHNVNSIHTCREFLLSIKGLGLKSVECVRLLTLHQLAFPVSRKQKYAITGIWKYILTIIAVH